MQFPAPDHSRLPLSYPPSRIFDRPMVERHPVAEQGKSDPTTPLRLPQGRSLHQSSFDRPSSFSWAQCHKTSPPRAAMRPYSTRSVSTARSQALGRCLGPSSHSFHRRRTCPLTHAPYPAAQSSLPRSATVLLPPRRVRHHGSRLVQNGAGYSRTEVRIPAPRRRPSRESTEDSKVYGCLRRTVA